MWLTIILWAVAAIYLCIVLSTVMVVVLENRQPVKTIAWTLVLVTLPVVGLVFFYFFGQNIRKDRIINRNAPGFHRRRQLAAAIHRSATGIPAHYAPVVHLFERLNMALPFGGNHIDLYTDGAAFTLALLKAIGSARHHIHLQSYIIDDDCVGRLVADALIDKAREGVEVRLIYDDVGCWNVPARFFERLAQGGVEARSFLPVRFPSLTHKVNYRNHRKVCVVDGRVGFVGGMNLARRYVRGVGGTEWRDLHLRLTGPAVSGLQHTFLTDWYFVAHSLLADSAYYPLADQPPAGEGDVVQIVTTDPGVRWPDIMYGLTWIIQNARRYLYTLLHAHRARPASLADRRPRRGRRPPDGALEARRLLAPLGQRLLLHRRPFGRHPRLHLRPGLPPLQGARGRRQLVDRGLHQHGLPELREQLRGQRLHLRPRLRAQGQGRLRGGPRALHRSVPRRVAPTAHPPPPARIVHPHPLAPALRGTPTGPPGARGRRSCDRAP